MQMFPQPAHPPAPHPAHMVPPAGVVPGPPMPPPSYEEDSAAQQAAAAVAVGQQPPQHRGYVYAYPQYGYPPQVSGLQRGVAVELELRLDFTTRDL